MPEAQQASADVPPLDGLNSDVHIAMPVCECGMFTVFSASATVSQQHRMGF